MILDRVLERALTAFSRSPETVASHSRSVTSGHDPGIALSLLAEVYPELLSRVANARVLDFGCGWGYQAVALANSGADSVVGVDINAEWLEKARRLAAESGVSNRVRFVQMLDPADTGRFDLVLSQDSMEHFPDPEGALRTMAAALAPGGDVVITFAPPWYAPYGAHMHFFTPIPWVHLLMPERTVMRVRARYKHDAAQRYEEVEGGLNRMSLKRFRRLLRLSGLALVRLSTEPVKGQRLVSRMPLLEEFFTNRVTAVLRRSAER